MPENGVRKRLPRRAGLTDYDRMGAFCRHFLKGMAGAVCIFPARHSVPPEVDGNYFRAAGDRIRIVLASEGPKIRSEAAQLELQFNGTKKVV